MIHYVTEYAALDGENNEHIWKRKPGMGLWRSLCGKLSDGEGMRLTDDATACPLCERIQQVQDEAAQKKVQDERYHIV